MEIKWVAVNVACLGGQREGSSVLDPSYSEESDARPGSVRMLRG